MGERLTRGEIAAHFGVTRQRVDELVNEGKLKEERATIDLAEAEALWASFPVDYVQRDRAGKDMRGAAGGGDKGGNPVSDLYNRAKAKTAALKAQQLELKLQIERGAYVPKELVTQQAYSAAKAFTVKLNNIGRRLAPQLAVLVDPAEIEALLQGELDRIIQELRDDFGAIG